MEVISIGGWSGCDQADDHSYCEDQLLAWPVGLEQTPKAECKPLDLATVLLLGA